MQRQRLSPPCWQQAEQAHQEHVDALVAAYLRRRDRGRTHPVDDFLFRYYQHRPARLRRWHPGADVLLVPDDRPSTAQRATWRYYRYEEDGIGLDVQAYLADRSGALRWARDLLTATAARQPYFGCWGLHEWAMVYRAEPEAIRHAGWPLRLGPAGTDRVVEEHRIRCSHADAYRFFTPAARPLNLLSPTRQTQLADEQPGCLHAVMDLYKYAVKLTPAVSSELTVACFDLARRARQVDMRAAPYDLSALGYPPIAIETAEGKAEYLAAQRELAEDGQRLRARLVQVCTDLLAQMPLP